MNEQYQKSLTKLELDKVLALLADHASSPAAKERCLAVRPLDDAEDIRLLQAQTSAACKLITLKGSPSFGGIVDVGASLSRADRGGCLSPEELLRVATVLKAAFELRLACIGGYEPDLTGCAVCGRADCGRFLVSGGCLQCLECGLGEGLSLPVSAGCLAAMRYITGCDAKRLFSFSLDGPARKELADAAETYLVTQLERGFYTLDFYKSLLLT